MRIGITVVVIGVTIFVGMMLVAKSDLQARIDGLRADAGSMCSSRAATAPTQKQLEDKVAALADARGVSLSDLEVTIEALRTHPDAASALVQAKLAETGAVRRVGRSAHASAHASAKKWLWRVEDEIEASCTLEERLERVNDKLLPRMDQDGSGDR